MFRHSSFFYITRNINQRLFNTAASRFHPIRRALLNRRTFARTTLGALTFGSLACAGTTVFADADADLADLQGHGQCRVVPFSSLIRAYVVFSMCSIPWLVDVSPMILKTFSSVPVVREVTEGFLRMTFFKQFVGADTVDECVPVLHALRKANQGVLLAYSVEDRSVETSSGSETPSEVIPYSHRLAVQDLLHSIDVAADFEDGIFRQSHYSETGSGSITGRSTWVAIKMSTLLADPYALVVLSRYILNARERLGIGSKTDVPFPGAPRIQDFDAFLSHGSSSEPSSMNFSEKEAQLYLHDLRVLYSDLVNICTRARDRGITITIDAEESWYQPAIDLLTLGLMRKFNSLSSADTQSTQFPWQSSQNCFHRPLIYLTLQAYLRRTPSFLAFILEDAKKNQYALGVKLVRGAYWEAETTLHSQALDRRPSNGADTGAYSKATDVKASELGQMPHSNSICLSTEPYPPVWLSKRDTDEAYNECVRALLKEVKEDVEICRAQCEPQERTQAQISAYFGTHNWKSTRLVLEEVVRNGLGEVVGQPHARDELLRESIELEGDFVVKIDEDVVQRVAMGQLYGMSDDLSEWLVSHTLTQSPFVIRYLPYGPLQHVMPYLSRRAIENKSVLGAGGAVIEKKRAAKEILTRVRKFFG